MSDLNKRDGGGEQALDPPHASEAAVCGNSVRASTSPSAGLELTIDDLQCLKEQAQVWRASSTEGTGMYRAELQARAMALESLIAEAAGTQDGEFKFGNGGEVVIRAEPDAPWREQELSLATRDPPTLVNAEASRERLQLAREAYVLPMAVDMAERANATTPGAQMLAHQVATAHQLAMRLAAKSQGYLDRKYLSHSADPQEAAREQLASIEASRLATASAKMMEATARGVMALDRLQNGARQTIVVHQKVDVQPGAQAMVNGAAALTPGRGKSKGKS